MHSDVALAGGYVTSQLTYSAAAVRARRTYGACSTQNEDERLVPRTALEVDFRVGAGAVASRTHGHCITAWAAKGAISCIRICAS